MLTSSFSNIRNDMFFHEFYPASGVGWFHHYILPSWMFPRSCAVEKTRAFILGFGDNSRTSSAAAKIQSRLAQISLITLESHR
jgi:hypothetical protein